MARNGQLEQADFFDNIGGTNLADSVFKIADNQAAGGFNFDYTLTGGFRKRLGPSLINTVADTELRTLGLGQYSTAQGSKTLIRAAGTKLQTFDPSAPSFTALTKDTAVDADPFASGSTQSVGFVQFNNGSSNILWGTGGGATLPVGAVSTTEYTANGMAEPVGALGTTVTPADAGNFAATGDYAYAIAYHKASTGVLSNVALDDIATIASTSDSVTITLTGLSGLDTTLVDEIYIYRSALNAADGFTTGELIAQIPSTDTSYTDRGDYLETAANIARAGNVLLDNSTLPSGTYNVSTLYKRRLVTAQDSTVYISDVNKSESWPLTNYITVPSAGKITALAVISFTSPQAQTLDEILVIYKEREMWVITGDDYTTFTLKFIDQVGCIDQNLVVLANGFLSWIDFRGVYLWDGTSKPIYCSRLLEPLFRKDGDLDKVKLGLGTGEFLRKENLVVWYLSSKIYGEQKFTIKLDLRLTLPRIEQTMTGRNIDAVLLQDTLAFPVYAALSHIPQNGSDEMMVLGDDAGFCYYASNGTSDAGEGIEFAYLTKPLAMENPNVQKLFHTVVAWVEDVGTWDLTLDYWSNFRTSSAFQSTKALPYPPSLSSRLFGMSLSGTSPIGTATQAISFRWSFSLRRARQTVTKALQFSSASVTRRPTSPSPSTALAFFGAH